MRQILLNIVLGSRRLYNAIQIWRDRRAGHPVLDMERYIEDPFPVVKELLAEKPIHRFYASNGWLVLGHEEFRELMKRPELSFELEASPMGHKISQFVLGTDFMPLLEEPWMLNRDPPDHTRLRKLTALGFTHRFIESKADRIREIFEQLVNQQPEEFDYAAEVAQKLPAIVIAELLGVPEQDREKFQHWSEELLVFLDPSDIRHLQRAAVASVELREYLVQLVEKKRGAKQDDLISALITAEEDGDALSAEEIYSNCALLLVAGHETTSRLLTTGLLMLLRHPEQMADLRKGKYNMDACIEECLRYEPPVLGLFRLVKQDFTAFGCELKQNQIISFSIAAANRDPRVFDQPDDFDLGRSHQANLSFGYGIHICLGMALTRMEANIVFTGMLDRYKEISLVREPTWGTHPIYRSPTELRIRCS